MCDSVIIRSVRKNKKQKNRGQVIIPDNHPNPPLPHEVNMASVLAQHYQTVVQFIVPVDDYKRKSADIVMHGVQWELKCPTGASKSTIRNQFRRASRQSKNIVIDVRRTKLEYSSIEKEVLFQIKERPYIKKVILIDKFEKCIDFIT